jgi:hypothetical protein
MDKIEGQNHDEKAEISRLEIMHRLEAKRLTQKEAAKILGLCVRQVKLIWRIYLRDGADGRISKKRSQPGNNRPNRVPSSFGSRSSQSGSMIEN